MKNYMHKAAGVQFYVLASADLIPKLNNIGFGWPKIPTVMAAMAARAKNERQH